MARIEKSVVVEVPVKTAYNQWTQFEEFPQFMDGVESVRQISDDRLYWVAHVAGHRKEWEARITEQVRDQIIAWRTEDNAADGGTVRFEEEDPGRTKVTVVMEHNPHGVVEHVGSALGFASGQVGDDLKRFKEFIEARGVETGQWRGEIHPEGESDTGATPMSQPARDTSEFRR